MTDAAGLIDFHNHVMPGVDDGASDDEEAAFALRSLMDQGVSHIIATPHVEGSLTLRPAGLERRLAALDAGWAALQRVALDHVPDITLYRGAEVMLDTPEPDLSDDRLRLAGGTFVLVEYPFMMVPPHSGAVIRTIVSAGFTPIIAHPERYTGVRDAALPAQWRSHGALLQVNSGSLTGRYGPQAKENAFALLERGLVDYLCSDYHARGRPSVQGGRGLLAEMGAAEQAELLTAVNPRRLLDGQLPLPLEPVRVRRSVLNRLQKWLR